MNSADMPATARMIALAFGGAIPGAKSWIKPVTKEMRIVRDAKRKPAACLLGIPMGQYFGGKSVSMLGIAGVAVPPERRGQGLALGMMQASVVEAHARGFALACLYASTQALYRQVGYEQAGHRWIWKVPCGTIDVRDRGLPFTSITDADTREVVACYKRFASRTPGMLDRRDYIWGRVKTWRDMKFDGFAIRRKDGTIGGYVYLNQKRKDSGRLDLIVQDLAFDDASMGRRLLGFLADFGSMVDDVQLTGGPWHPLLMLMPMQRYSASFKDFWMTRIIDLPKAIKQRGWPSGLNVQCRLHITDDLIAANAGEWELSVASGKASVSRVKPSDKATGAGRALRDGVTCDIRALAAVYTGFVSPRDQQLVGAMTGDAKSIGALAEAFAGPTPWMVDFF